MGGSRFDATDFASFTRSATKGGTAPISSAFTARAMTSALDPKDIAVRESRDSAANPQSTPVIVGLDVTGSMGSLSHTIANSGMKVLFEAIYDRKPVTDPHIMFMGIGDVAYDRSPLQVSQFEADIRLAEQLISLHIEGGGGGNHSESYTLPWYFAAMKVSADAIEKRGKKGYLFTVGDEECPKVVRASEFEKVFGPGQWTDLTTQQLLDMVQRNWHTFHIVAEEGDYCRQAGADHVVRSWNAILGQRVIRMSDHTKLAEIVVSAMQVTEGESVAAVAKSWGGDTSLVVSRAVSGLVPAATSGAAGTALTDF